VLCLLAYSVPCVPRIVDNSTPNEARDAQLVTEVVRLFDALYADELTPEDSKRLSALLCSTQQAANIYVELVEQRAALRLLLGPPIHVRNQPPEDLQDGAQAVFDACAPVTSAFQNEQNAEHTSRSSQDVRASNYQIGGNGFHIQHSLIWAAGSVCAVAALLWLALTVWVDHSSESDRFTKFATVSLPISRPPAPVATLTSSEKAQWSGSQLTEGHVLYEGDSIHLEKGRARISVGYGAEIVADGQCKLTFLDRARVRNDFGTIAVDVAEWAKGFSVVTDAMEVVDLGTTFTVSTSPGAKTETSVLKGLVRVHPSKLGQEDRQGLLLSEGQGISIDRQGRRTAIQLVPSEILSNLDFGTLAPYRPVDLCNTGFGLAVGDEDPHWRVIAGPEGAFVGPEYAAVCVPDKRYLANDPQSSQWVSTTGWQEAAPFSIYTFQTSFRLTGYDLTTIQLFGRFLADNGVQEVRVNGKTVRIESWSDEIRGQRFEVPQFRFINVTSGLIQGQNTVEIDVRNGGIYGERAIPNPVALRVEWYAFGRNKEMVDSGNRFLRRGTVNALFEESLVKAAIAAP